MNDHNKKDREQILVFVLSESRYALHLNEVLRVIQAVEVTPLPNAPQSIPGVINMQGQIIPVVDIRPCLGMAACEVDPDNLFILARSARRLMALVADSVSGVLELTEMEMVNADQILPGITNIHGLAKSEGGLVLLCDLDQFLSLEDERVLTAALDKEPATRQIKKKRRSQETQIAS